MSKSKRINDTSMSRQIPLIDTGLSEGEFDLGLGLKQLLSSELRSLDRWTIAAQLSKSTGVEISKDILDKRLGSDPAHQMYAIHMTPIAKLIGKMTPFQYLLDPLGSDVLNPEDRDLIELARLQEQSKIIETKMMEIRARRNLK